MSGIEQLVERLEKSIEETLLKMDALQQTNEQLEQALQLAHEKLQAQTQISTAWEDKFEALKMANTMLGSDNNKRETKLKINTLIREIDYCISELSE
ncbi:hypothetical protein IA57_00165 [Mangrovimonas yunxiaonensis]|uniref:Mis12-Mtw1 protein family n=1 Tax=Mangrovimonas yunxiaonensis TaxID=1197477 RepID=A0A084TN07_9FLAO|nr:hypothetical protein [Mangrovimonas yunxiaonensis]KFB02093.1 hypothetical protein IA57_00165 [Mangrovimonas yunxiaonensis]GGH47978.1 hypothetical protein GCM10011364_23220 [Mangrovimonas yunxiaonensis]